MRSARTIPPPPARFSMTTSCPSRAPIFCAATRELASVMPPGPKGQTQVTGRVGKPCADDAAERSKTGDAVSPPNRSLRANAIRRPSGPFARRRASGDAGA